jgi:hypothetical protein|tara:strand:- start:61 stop:468 length:408 start_codon:yes stop_codon:yes gene_type:complete
MPIESKISVDDLVEVKLSQPDDFLKVKETLTRIGISSRRENKLYQSCHILHKRGKYYIVHFKELFSLDGLPTDIDEKDIARRNTITSLLEEWGLVEVVDTDKIEVLKLPLNQLKILSFREKPDWELCPKYHIGKK